MRELRLVRVVAAVLLLRFVFFSIIASLPDSIELFDSWSERKQKLTTNRSIPFHLVMYDYCEANIDEWKLRFVFFDSMMGITTSKCPSESI